MKHKAGFINIIGKPNVGKSTILNKIIGEKMSIITSKPQTTRHRIFGIYNDEEYQIVFSDTPGFINDPHYELQKSMNKFVYSSFDDADGILFIVDVFDDFKYNQKFLERLKQIEVPKFLVVNKMDLGEQEKIKELINKWYELIKFDDVFVTSAKLGFNTDEIINKVKQIIPESPPFYPKEQFTDKTERFFIEEIIREKILTLYKQEVPYSVEVEVEEWEVTEKRGAPFIFIRTNIFVSRRTQKQIIIGKGGEKIKRLGIEARKDIENFLDTRVHLELYVKILENWRDNEKNLKRFGYNH